MRYAQLNQNGDPIAFFSTDVHGPLTQDGVRNPLIPEGVIAISDDVWMDCLQNPGRRRWNGQIMDVYTPPVTQTDLIAYAKNRRWEKEVAGIVIGGMTIATDDRSKVLIMGARIRADRDPDTTEIWDMPDGTTRTLDAQMIIDLSNAIAQHVSDLFNVFSEIKSDIEAGVIKTIEEIDAAFG